MLVKGLPVVTRGIWPIGQDRGEAAFSAPRGIV